MKGPIKLLGVRLAEPLHRELKVKCAMDGISQANAIEQLIRHYLDGDITLSLPAPGKPAPGKAVTNGSKPRG